MASAQATSIRLTQISTAASNGPRTVNEPDFASKDRAEKIRRLSIIRRVKNAKGVEEAMQVLDQEFPSEENWG